MIFSIFMAAVFSSSSYKCDTTTTRSGQKVHCREWSKKTKKIISSWSWLNGKPDGLCEEWFENGNLRLRHKYRAGLMIDTSIEYFSSGKIAGTYFCNSSGEHCQWIARHENGTLAKQGQSRQGKSVGTLMTYYPSGAQESLENFDPSGIRNGAHAHWSSKGILRDSVFYHLGDILYSVHRDTNSNKDICRWRWSYANSDRSLVEAECFDPQGASSGKVRAGTGSLTFFDLDGKMSGKETYLNGLLVKEERFQTH